MDEKSLSNQDLARELIRRPGAASLATLRSDGAPFASYVVTAPAADGAPLLLLSNLAVHAKNLAHDARASLLFVREPAAGDETLAAARVTLTGAAHKNDDPDGLKRYVALLPDAARQASFADFALYRFEIEAGHLVAGFGRIVGLTRDALLGR